MSEIFPVVTSAPVDIAITNNSTWRDAFQFGTDTDISWSFTDCSFHMDVKASREDTSAMLTLTTANGRIVVDDLVQRVLHFNVIDDDVEDNLPPTPDRCGYVYDLVMIDALDVRTVLMGGQVFVSQGITMS